MINEQLAFLSFEEPWQDDTLVLKDVATADMSGNIRLMSISIKKAYFAKVSLSNKYDLKEEETPVVVLVAVLDLHDSLNNTR